MSIAKRLNEIDTSKYTISELCDIVGGSYNTVYVTLKRNNLPYKKGKITGRPRKLLPEAEGKQRREMMLAYHREHGKEYRKTHDRSEYFKQYHIENRETILARSRKYHAENREARNAQSRKYYKENREELLEKRREKYKREGK